MSRALPERVAVVGAGTMGHGIAQVFAAHGARVTLVDVSEPALQKGLAGIEKSLRKLTEKGVIGAADAAAARERIAGSARLEDSGSAELVVEAVVEKADVKRAVFRELDRICKPGAILATNTSSISITEIASATSRPDKVAGMHFMNPVPLMRLVEVIRGQETSDETAAAVVGCCEALGKVPVEASDYPGFVSNRVLMPMINEAVYCLMEGVADAKGIDAVMQLGMNHPMGPLALADLIGLDVCLDVMTVIHAGLGDSKYRPCPLLRRYVAAGRLGRKVGRGFHTYA